MAAALAAPAWVSAWVGKANRIFRTASGIEMSVGTSANATMVTAIACKARVSNGEAFRDRTIDVYRALRQTIDETAAKNIVRIWNHIPGIHDPLDAQCDRYMHFNAGRFAAMCEWFGGADRIPESVPAASGVGHEGQDLIVRALATTERGIPVENPRQVPAFRYSKRYGPIPPCFARATRIAIPRPALLIAGTAAITGEASQYLGDLQRQLELTLENLRILIQAGVPELPASVDPLSKIDCARIYVAQSQDIPVVRDALQNRFGANTGSMEFLRADLCRADLLVEIEGVATL
jgi:chorismate lyase / 3-hydroxybenzoate synthase